MTIRALLKLGDARLLRRAQPVAAFSTPALRELVADLHETMLAHDGAGIAAPQIGVDLRVVIFGGKPTPRYPESLGVPYTVLINPELSPIGDDEAEGWEGCLSVPGLRGLVPRWQRLSYRGFDVEGQLIERTVEGFHARVVQHECDHLDGLLFPMRVRDLRQFGFTDVLFPDLSPAADD